jgi:hypothetical protein
MITNKNNKVSLRGAKRRSNLLNDAAQSTLEFTFAMIAVIFLIYAMVQLFRWAGMDLANRRVLMDQGITTQDLPNGDPSAQLNFDTNGAMPIAAFWHGSITNGQ